MIKKILRIILGGLVMYFIVWSMLRIPQKRIILFTKSIQTTLTEQRQIAVPVELTGITDSVIEINKEIELWQTVAKYLPTLFSEEFKQLGYVK